MNSQRILRCIWKNKGISRIEISKNLDLDKSTVTMTVSKLLKIGLVETVSEGKSSPLGGRKPIGLGINKSFGAVAGVDITSQSCEIIVTNLDGEIIYSEITSEEVTNKNLVKIILKLIGKAQKEIAKFGIPLIGIGLGVPGIINHKKGVVLKSNVLKISEDYLLAKEIQSKVELPVFVENDANCSAWGEVAFNKSSETGNFIFVLGKHIKQKRLLKKYNAVGVGFGIVIDGKVYYGNNFTAGEFQSVFWTSGNNSQFSISDSQMESMDKDKKIYLSLVEELSINLAMLISTLDFERIVLGGIFIDKYRDETEKIVKEAIMKKWSPEHKAECEILFSSFHKRAVALGAIGICLEHFFAIPQITIEKGKSSSKKYDIQALFKGII